jgi:hypothetical protein
MMTWKYKRNRKGPLISTPTSCSQVDRIAWWVRSQIMRV